jgi:glycine/D-amino acid oxidase-like deaminating enzyme
MLAKGRSADVVVVGAGIVGLSIAYQLARRGGGRVVVLEKGAGVAEGSTGASSACIRLRYTHGEVIRLAQAGMAIYRRWPEFTGLPSPRAAFAHTGVLWMLREDRATVESERDRMAALGARVCVLGADVVRERFALLSTCGEPFDPEVDHHECWDHPSYLFEEDGGYCTDPAGANQDLLDAARREGVDVRLRTGVDAVRSAGGRVQGVDLGDGSRIDAPVVVNAAGPWCNRVNAMAGLDLDWTLRPTRVQVLFRVSGADVSGGLPLVADAAGGIYFRPESGGQQLLVGSIRGEDERELVPDPDRYDRALDDAMQQRLLHALHHRLPGLPHRGRVTGIAGLYTVTDEDMHPVVGPTALEGFVVANGFSGHGFKLAPAVGAMLARWLTGRHADFDTDVPIDFLSVDRSSLAVREKNVLA